MFTADLAEQDRDPAATAAINTTPPIWWIWWLPTAAILGTYAWYCFAMTIYNLIFGL